MFAEDNMQVANCTTPANYFHILRRQMHRKFRKPLVIMTPKSLLRHKRATSTLSDMGPGTQFHRVLRDDAEMRPGTTLTLKPDVKIRRVILCSGKVYYDLLKEREERGQDDTYILRIEQLAPFPHETVVAQLARFEKLEKIVWCQEEPRNMGAWTYIEPYLEAAIMEAGSKQARPLYAGRRATASTATGLVSRHVQEQEALLDQALSI